MLQLSEPKAKTSSDKAAPNGAAALAHASGAATVERDDPGFGQALSFLLAESLLLHDVPLMAGAASASRNEYSLVTSTRTGENVPIRRRRARCRSWPLEERTDEPSSFMSVDADGPVQQTGLAR